MPGGESPNPADDAARALVEEVAAAVRSLTDTSWQRARLVATFAGVTYDKDVAFEIGDGTEVRPALGPELTKSIDRLQRHYRDHGAWMFELRCTLTPEVVEQVDVDTTSDPWPDGWDDPDDVTRIVLPPAACPEWLRARLDGLDRKRPTRAALWTAEAQHLLAHLGTDWDTRRSGNGLELIRRRGPWVLDVILFDRVRSPRGGRLVTMWLDLLDDVHHRTLDNGTYLNLASLEGPRARRRILQHVLGPGYFQLDHAHPARVAAKSGRWPDDADEPADWQARRDAKLAALGLDEASHKTLRRTPEDQHPVVPPVSWAELTGGLAIELARLPRDSVITVHEWRKGGAAVRMTRRRGDGSLQLELRADRYLVASSRGGTARDDRLRSLGWIEPEAHGHGLPSWSWPRSDDPETLAAVAVDVVRAVYGIERPERLGYTAIGGRDTVLRTPALPLLLFAPFRYVTRTGVDRDAERADNGSFAVTSAGRHELVDVDGTSYMVVDDPSTLRERPVLGPNGSLLVPAPDAVETISVSTIATPVGSTSAAGVVLQRQGTHLEVQHAETGDRRWVHEEDVTVTEVRHPLPTTARTRNVGARPARPAASR